MPIPFILFGAAAVAGVAGVAKGAKAVSNNSEAEHLIQKSERIYDDAKDRLENQRTTTTERLEHLGKVKLEIWSNEMDVFVKVFNSFKHVRMEGNVNLNEKLRLQMQNPQNLKNMEVASIKAKEVVKAGVASLGAGALAGIGSYGGAMMFASASTGTAIASLSGAAATNATLAYFGGGAISAGGFGMAGGAVALGGIVLGPILAVAGSIMKAKSEENLANARRTYAEAKEAVEKMDTMTDFMSSIANISDDYANFLVGFRGRFKPSLNELIQIQNNAFKRKKQIKRGLFDRLFGDHSKIDFGILSLKEQKTLHVAWLMAQVLYSVLAAPLLEQNGDLHRNAQSTLNDAKDAIPKIEQAKKELQQIPDDTEARKMQMNKNCQQERNTSVYQSQQMGAKKGSAPNCQSQQNQRRNVPQYQYQKSNMGHDSNECSVVWKVFSILMSVWNWIYGVTFVFVGIGMFQEDYRVAITFLCSSIIVCPVMIYKKSWTDLGKFINKIIRFLIGCIILVLGLIIFFGVIPNV